MNIPQINDRVFQSIIDTHRGGVNFVIVATGASATARLNSVKTLVDTLNINGMSGLCAGLTGDNQAVILNTTAGDAFLDANAAKIGAMGVVYTHEHLEVIDEPIELLSGATPVYGYQVSVGSLVMTGQVNFHIVDTMNQALITANTLVSSATTMTALRVGNVQNNIAPIPFI